MTHLNAKLEAFIEQMKDSEELARHGFALLLRGLTSLASSMHYAMLDCLGRRAILCRSEFQKRVTFEFHTGVRSII